MVALTIVYLNIEYNSASNMHAQVLRSHEFGALEFLQVHRTTIFEPLHKIYLTRHVLSR